MMMGEICSFSNQRISAVELSPYNYTGVENLLQEMKGRKDASALPSSNVAEVSEGDILVGNIRPYLQKIWLATCDGGASADVLVLRIIDQTQVLSSYLYRVLASDRFFDFHASTARGGKMPRGDRKRILEFRVPVPSLDEQRRISGILDQMNALVNDLSSGLPAEIAARRKQYEYYRDRLLSFPELTEPTAMASPNTQEPTRA